MKAWDYIVKKGKELQVLGFIFGVIFAHFDHHESLYYWLKDSTQMVEIESGKTWYDPTTWGN